MGFGATKPAHDVLILAQSGETFEVEVKKNDNGYNDWISAVKSNGAASSAPVNSRPAGGQSQTAATPAPRSNYETPEERAKKQVYIVRQSSISAAISTLAIGAKSKPDPKEVIEVAKQYESYVFETEEVGSFTEADVAKPSDLDDDIPF